MSARGGVQDSSSPIPSSRSGTIFANRTRTSSASATSSKVSLQS